MTATPAMVTAGTVAYDSAVLAGMSVSALVTAVYDAMTTASVTVPPSASTLGGRAPVAATVSTAPRVAVGSDGTPLTETALLQAVGRYPGRNEA